MRIRFCLSGGKDWKECSGRESCMAAVGGSLARMTSRHCSSFTQTRRAMVHSCRNARSRDRLP